MFRKIAIAVTVAGVFLVGANANANLLWIWDSGDGLSAAAEVSQIDIQTIQIVILNTSTALPSWMPVDSSNQILTSISFNLPAGITIVGGSAVLGQGAMTVNFDNVASQLSAGANVSGEWGFGNQGDKNNLARNFISTLQAHTTPFGGPNLDGPAVLGGPQGGLIANPMITPLGGLGAIQGPVIFNIQLSGGVALSDIAVGGIEFGSDAAFVGGGQGEPVPEPATLAMLSIGGMAFVGAKVARRRSARPTA